jgi:S-adenosylmethionine hydrolase
LLSPVIDDDARAVVRSVERREWFLREVSATFHGRDVFAPVAARLARGASLSRVGPIVRRWSRVALPKPRRHGDTIEGEVLDADRFGNARTNVPGEWTRVGAVVVARGRSIAAVASTYADVEQGEAVAMIGSSGLLEIAVRGGDAVARFRLTPGTRITLENGRFVARPRGKRHVL